MKLYIYPAFFLFYLIILISLFGINFPFFDQWEFVDELDKFYQGSLTAEDLFAQHNEHRIFFPYLIMLGLAYATNWNIFYELLVNIFLGLCIFLVVLYQIKQTFPLKEYPYRNSLMAVLSLLFFSMAQSENWIWGWQIQIFLNVLMICIGISYLSKSNTSFTAFILAIVSGIIATFSFANGMVFWIIGFLIIFLNEASIRLKLFQSLIWLIIFGAVFYLYVADYHRPEHHPYPTQLSIDFILGYITFTFAYLGAVIFESDGNVAVIFGILGVIIYCYGAFNIYNNQSLPYRKYLIYLYLSFYSIASALVTALGRTGVAQAASSRYLTITNLFWLCNFVILFTLLDVSFHNSKLKSRIIQVTIAVLFTTMFASHFVGTKDVVNHYYLMKSIREEVLSEKPDSILIKEAYPKVSALLEQKEILKKYRLTFYKE